jgi:hypothetical protein
LVSGSLFDDALSLELSFLRGLLPSLGGTLALDTAIDQVTLSQPLCAQRRRCGGEHEGGDGER